MPDATDDQWTRQRNVKFALLWLMYLLYPVWYLLSMPLGLVSRVAGFLIIGAFVAGYTWYWSHMVALDARGAWHGAYVAFTVLVAVLLDGLFRNPGFLEVTIYAAPALAWRRHALFWYGGMVGVVGVTLGALATFHQWTIGNLLSVAIPLVTVGVGMRLVFRYVALQIRLQNTQQENVRLAAANERLRIGRDLHDVLGHTLSAIAMRADLARSEAERIAPAAASEMARVAEMARDALTDVRSVVTGYRAVNLEEEWNTFKETASAAGIQTDGTVDSTSLPPHIERSLALVLREAGTNLVRHSGATHCTVTLYRDAGHLVLRVDDDGQGGKPSPGGSGLQSIAERVASLGGRCSAGSRPPGQRGFRLEVSVPVGSEQRPPAVPPYPSGGGARTPWASLKERKA